ncbi:MAG: SHOCT domain-containing protein [Solirubrobacterales bacterium]
MRYYVLTSLAVVVFAGCVYLLCDKLTYFLDVGTCASGNTPYVPRRECPDGTAGDFFLMMGSVIGLFLAMGILGARGPRPGGGGIGFGSMVVIGWGLFFSIVGAVSLTHALTSDVIGEDGKLGGIIVGATFLVMGVPALLFTPKLILDARRTSRGIQSAETVYASDEPGGQGWLSTLRTSSKLMKDLSRQVSTGGSVGSSDSVGSTGSSSYGFGGSSAGSSADDSITKLERLQKLRESGALSESEFEREKARILGG